MATGRPISVAIDEENDVATFSATHTHVLPIQLVSIQQCTACRPINGFRTYCFTLHPTHNRQFCT